MLRAIRNKKGAQMVEASIAIPIIILISMLLVRLFVFYLDILATSVKEHELAIDAVYSYEGIGIKEYENEVNLTFVRGGLLSSDLGKTIRTEGYIYNPDAIIRAGELIEKN